MSGHTVEIVKHGAAWIAHRDHGHDCAADDAEKYHGVAESEVGALRRLIRLETGQEQA